MMVHSPYKATLFIFTLIVYADTDVVTLFGGPSEYRRLEDVAKINTP